LKIGQSENIDGRIDRPKSIASVAFLPGARWAENRFDNSLVLCFPSLLHSPDALNIMPHL
jgi:hypothetical protein